MPEEEPRLRVVEAGAEAEAKAAGSPPTPVARRDRWIMVALVLALVVMIALLVWTRTQMGAQILDLESRVRALQGVVSERDRTIEFRFDELWQRGFAETPAELLARPKGEEEMGYAELGRYIDAIERSGSKTGKLRVEQQLKLAFPFTCFIIVMFGLPLANSSRKGGASMSIGVALGTTILFLVLVRVAQAMGAADVIPPVAAAWLANVVFLLAGLILFWRVKT